MKPQQTSGLESASHDQYVTPRTRQARVTRRVKRQHFACLLAQTASVSILRHCSLILFLAFASLALLSAPLCCSRASSPSSSCCGSSGSPAPVSCVARLASRMMPAPSQPTAVKRSCRKTQAKAAPGTGHQQQHVSLDNVADAPMNHNVRHTTRCPINGYAVVKLEQLCSAYQSWQIIPQCNSPPAVPKHPSRHATHLRWAPSSRPWQPLWMTHPAAPAPQ